MSFCEVLAPESQSTNYVARIAIKNSVNALKVMYENRGLFQFSLTWIIWLASEKQRLPVYSSLNFNLLATSDALEFSVTAKL